MLKKGVKLKHINNQHMYAVLLKLERMTPVHVGVVENLKNAVGIKEYMINK